MISRQIFLIALLCLGLSGTHARAQMATPASSAEDIAIAFFRAGDTNPDFDLWAKNSKEYKVAAPVRASDVLFEEKQRLMKKWRGFNKDESLLTIETNVDIDLKTATGKDGVEQHWMYISFPQGEVTYFPYKFLEYEFAVIPQQMDTLLVQYLQKPQYDLMLESFKQKTRGNAYLSLQLKAARSYVNQPYPIDGKDFWVLLTDIATMSVLSPQDKRTMWNYGADWYVSPVTQGVMDLYAAPSEGPVIPASP